MLVYVWWPSVEAGAFQSQSVRDLEFENCDTSVDYVDAFIEQRLKL